MRNRWLWNAPHVKSICLLALALLPAVLAGGCGGGGGGGGNNGGGGGTGCNPAPVPPGNPALATIIGTVKDTAGAAVNGALVTVIVPGGTNINGVSDCNGKFTITNVPLNVTGFKVNSPNTSLYYNYGNYKGNLYDLIYCTLPLPTLSAGTNAPYTEIDMYPAGLNPPPPPPANGCPV